MSRRGVYPGSFNPTTVAHVAIAEATVVQKRLDQLVFAISQVTLAKDDLSTPSPEMRAGVLRDAVSHFDWARVEIVDTSLIADIAAGYDVVVMGADKWHQIHEVEFYDGSARERDRALARLPELAIAGRGNSGVPHQARLDLPAWVGEVSSTAVRNGRSDWLANPN